MARFVSRTHSSQSDVPIHHPAKQTSRDDAKWKAEQEQRCKEEAIANTTGIRVLSAIGAAVPCVC
jgi:ParB family chromosome partitioning protein